MQTRDIRTMSTHITGISSQATRQVLGEMAQAYRASHGVDVSIESVGGVVAARRVQSGEAFDVVVLASDAIETLVGGGHVVAGSRTDLVRSRVAIGIRSGARRQDISSEEALRQAVLSARKVGYSTGPSGTALLKLFARWGIHDVVRDRIVQALPGVPVAQLVASGEIELGFQQYSEMANVPGVEVLGTMPPGTEIVTTFAAAVCTASRQPAAARDLLAFMSSPARLELVRRQGFEPA
jgi:molybdate transport system substrate-binding protein